MAQLPPEVVKYGVKIAKEENSILMYLNLFSRDTTFDQSFLYNYADLNVLSQLKRIPGVGYADILGAREYAIRIWLKADRMLAYNISTEVYNELLKIKNMKEEQSLRTEVVDELTEAVEVSSQLFRTGRADYVEVLLAQKNCLEAKMELLNVKRKQYFAMVNLYKALGGGWK